MTCFKQPIFFYADINQSDVEDSFQLASEVVGSNPVGDSDFFFVPR